LDLEQVAWAELDGNLDWSPVPARGTDGGLSLTSAGALDSFRDPGLPALGTQHTLEIQAGPHQQLWLLEKTASGFEGRLMFDTR
jgi:hypothetical protein